MITLDDSIKNLTRINSRYWKKLEKLGIFTVRNLLLHFPFRYEDYSEIIPIAEIRIGEMATIIGKIEKIKNICSWKKRMSITEVLVSDNTGKIPIIWFNQPYLADNLAPGKEIRLSGKLSSGKKGVYFSSPAWEFSQREPTNTGRLVPIYPETEGLSSRWFRWQIRNVLKLNLKFKDPIPENLLKKLNLPDLQKSILYAHFPKNQNQYMLAQKRTAFEEMFLMQLKASQIKASSEKEHSAKIPFDEKLIKNFTFSLPFKLTNAQRKASFEILKDLEKSRPMNRLLNGDVGSGKTIVAAIASLQTAKTGFQVALMAPTEILAFQHFQNISRLFSNHDFSIALFTNSYHQLNSETKINRSILLKKIKSGEIDLIIGTHSLIQKDVYFQKLALIIIDEQHRFGVSQRSYLQQKTREINDGIRGKIPHFLTMTATPIPRTLALAFFGNLDLSILDEMPKNRKKIITEIVTYGQRNKIYNFIRSEIKKGRQCFVILPLVEDSKFLTEIKAAVSEHQRLSEEIFPDLKIGLVHGKLKSSEKEEVMKKFSAKELDILVATAVVEVGIDIPNATVMIIEDADRFGLSQLHQFRGRIGRGEHQSYCFLFTSSNSIMAKKRLQVLAESQDGFVVAEKDLQLRGPGEFFGSRQSGLPDIAMENLTNVKLIRIAREEAQNILSKDPGLKMYPWLKNALQKFDENVHLE